VPEIRNHVVYPLAEVEAEFSAFFLNSSLSLMAAIAIMEIEQIRKARRGLGPIPANIPQSELTMPDSDDVIGFWGVDMSAREEYLRQKPGCWFFGLEIIRRGIGLIYPPESDLFCPEPVYGLCEWDHDYIKATARMREINARKQQTQAQLQTLNNQLLADVGATDDMDYYIKTWLSPYRLPAGVVMRQDPGSGLGVTVRSVDGVPVSGAGPANVLPYVGRVAPDAAG
jgi:hypothetical protein